MWLKARIFLDIYVPGYDPKVHFLTAFGLNNNKKDRLPSPTPKIFVILLNIARLGDRILTDFRQNAVAF